MKLHTWTLARVVRELRKKTIKLSDVYDSVLGSIDERNGEINAYLAVDHDAAEGAKEFTDRLLAGVPIAVKDNFLTTHLPTTASARLLDGFMSPYESTVTKRLQEAGGYVVGKTNMDAWAHGSSTETSDYGPTKNPRNTDYLPGGSSGGSAAAVAADMCIAAIGSETAGSIRQPASWCGVVGLKPTYGRVSRAGVVAMGSSLDSPGPLGKTVEDCAMLLGTIAGHDRYDATTADQPVPDYTKSLRSGVKGKKIGIVYMDHPNIAGTEVDTAVRRAGSVFERLGAHVEDIPLSDTLKPNTILTPDYAIGVYTVVQRGEVSSNLARYDGIRYGDGREMFSKEAKRRIMLGTFTLSKGYADKYYVRAQQVRSMYIRNFAQLFETYDILLSTPTPGYALPLGSLGDNPMFGELQDVLVEPSSLAGLPGMSVPCGKDDATGLYLGLNIMTPQWAEETMIAAAAAFEDATAWNPWKGKES